jgi:hypothetical protein
MLQNCTMLADMTIHRWTASKHDRSVSAEVERTHNANNAGRYNKQLIDKAHLATIDTLGNQLRAFHYRLTLPWSDKGARLLPSKLFMQYQEGFASLRDQREKAVEDFLRSYPTLVQAARTRLNSMFEPSDYPSAEELRRSFGVELEIMPVPSAADFRLDVINDEMQTGIRNDIVRKLHERQAQATKDCWARVKEVVGRISEQCSKPKGRIHDSLMENAADLATLLDGLNITNDPGITSIEDDLRALIVDPDQLRNSAVTRSGVGRLADSILQRIPEIA